MWLSRLLSLLIITALAVFGAGALGLATHRDAALGEAGAGRVAGEARALAAELAASLSQHRRAAETAVRDPEVQRALSSVTADMPPHVRDAVLVPTARTLASHHRPYNFVLVDPAGQLAGASAADLATGWAFTLEELDRLADGKPLKTPRTLQWAIVLPLPWTIGGPAAPPGAKEPPPPPAVGRLVVLGPMPVELATSLHQETRSTDTLVLLEAAKPTGPGADSELAKAVTGIFPGKVAQVSAAGTQWQAMRTLVPGVHEFYVVLAWPAPPAPTLADLGGVGGIFKRATPTAATTQLLVGLALVGWLLVLLTGALALRGLGRRLGAAVAQPGVAFPLAASKWPGWLRGVVEHLNEWNSQTVELRRRAEDKPLHSSVAPPTRPVQAMAAPTVPVSPVAPAETSAEKSGERAAEASVEKSAEKSAERSAEKSTEKSAEKPADRPKGSAGKGARPAPPATPAAASGRTPPKVPALDRDDLEPVTQTDVELRPAAVGLLSKLHQDKALPTERGKAGAGKHDNTAIRAVPAELLSAMRDEANRDTGMGPAPQPTTPEEEAYFESVWVEFSATKANCGEPVEPADFRKFRAKLIRTRAQLIDRFKCKDVRFRVYVKDGKAALKASPVLEEDAAGDEVEG